MDKVNYLQTIGFPLETNTLDFMQNAYTVFNAFGNLAGDKVIISGCELIGSTTKDGVIFFNGELLTFKGGVNQSTIIITENVTTAIFEDGDTKDVYAERYATFGTGTAQITWADFTRVESLTSLKTMIDNLQPLYKEVKWIPRAIANEDLRAGWFIADGTKGTDNLLGQGLIGYNPDDNDLKTPGTEVGVKTNTLKLENLPNIELSGTTDSKGSHSHTYNDRTQDDNGSTDSRYSAGSGDTNKITDTTRTTGSAGNHSHGVTVTINGESVALNNLPPSVVAIPIQYIG